MNSIFLSIVIPMYNTSKYIIRCLESINKQIDKDLEIIVIDDGSKDDSYETAKFYLVKNKLCHKIVKESNKGVSNARNLGISLSRGEYILFLDSDDFIDKNLVKECKEILSKQSLDVLYFGYDKIDESNNVIWKYSDCYEYIEKPKNGHEIVYDIFNGKIEIGISSAIYRRELIINNNIKFLINCFNAEDHNFVIKLLLKSNNVYNTDRILSHYYQRCNSISHIFSVKRLTLIYAYEDLSVYIKDNLNDNDLVNIINRNVIPVNILNNILLMVKAANRKDIVNILNQEKVHFYLKNYKNSLVLNQSKKVFLYIKLAYYCPDIFYLLSKMLSEFKAQLYNHKKSFI